MIKRVAMIAALALAAPAHAQEVTVDPDHLISVLDDAGYPAEYFSREAEYRQIIISKPGAFQFLVELYDCEQGKTCDTLEFFVGFPMDHPPDKAALDAYAGPREGADISLDRRGAPRMILPVEVPEDGLTDTVFIDQVKHWEAMMSAFVAFLKGEAPAAAAATAAPATS